MTHEEQVRANLEHAFELFRELLEQPGDLDLIPDGANVVPMPVEVPELCAANEVTLRALRLRAAARRDSTSGPRSLSATTLLVNV
jgi:hypothetical protein